MSEKENKVLLMYIGNENDPDDEPFEIGEVYEFTIDEWVVEIYEIIIDGVEYTFTIEPDERGLSYKNWFKIVEQEESI